MHYKTNRVNHDFQIIHFIAGSCHTPDGAYGILCDLQEDRSNALKLFAAEKLREEAKRKRAEASLQHADESARLEAQANILEIDALAETSRKNYEAAVKELATIENCMRAVDPLRKYKHLSAADAHEAAQAEEWKLELIHRGENYLLTSGTIPADHFATMRLHPEFHNAILPAINEVRFLLEQPNGQVQLLERISGARFDLPQLLQLSESTPSTLS